MSEKGPQATFSNKLIARILAKLTPQRIDGSHESRIYL